MAQRHRDSSASNYHGNDDERISIVYVPEILKPDLYDCPDIVTPDTLSQILSEPDQEPQFFENCQLAAYGL